MDSLTSVGGDLLDYYFAGGWVMHPISACSLFATGVIFYKLVVFRRVRMNFGEFVAGVRQALLKNDLSGAVKVCEAQRSPVASILKTGLLKYGRSRDEIEKSMENAAIHEVAYLEKYLTVLATVTNIAPLLGFLGTVVGMILSFETLAEQGLNNPAKVASGISVALITTAYGLIVAFVTQPFYNYFLSRVSTYTREMETASNILFETMDEIEEQGPGARRATTT